MLVILRKFTVNTNIKLERKKDVYNNSFIKPSFTIGNTYELILGS